MITRKRLPELLDRPFRRGMSGDIVMEDSTGAQFHDYKYVQGAECGRDHDEEVTGDDHLGMVTDETQPTLLWIARAYRSTRAQVLSHSAGRNPYSEFQLQFVGNAFLSPCLRSVSEAIRRRAPDGSGQSRTPNRF